MDLVTQIQNYMSIVSRLFADHTNALMQREEVPVTERATPQHLENAQVLEEWANTLFLNVADVDVLMMALPDQVPSREEQIKTLQKLEEENKAAGERLKQAQLEAAIWQERLSSVLRQSAEYNLNSN